MTYRTKTDLINALRADPGATVAWLAGRDPNGAGAYYFVPSDRTVPHAAPELRVLARVWQSVQATEAVDVLRSTRTAATYRVRPAWTAAEPAPADPIATARADGAAFADTGADAAAALDAAAARYPNERAADAFVCGFLDRCAVTDRPTAAVPAAPADAQWWTSSSGAVELQLGRADAQACAHPGPCDADVSALRRVPYVAAQLDALSPAVLADVLAEYGAWGDAELQDHDANLDRVLWVACGDIADGDDDASAA